MTFVLTVCGALGAFLFIVPGCGLLVSMRGSLGPQLRLVTTPFAGLLVLYCAATACHLAAASLAFWRLAWLLAAAGWWRGRHDVLGWIRDPESKILIGGWALLTTTALLLTAGIRNYSGGDWIGDWAGHFHRAQYFLHPAQDWAWMFGRDPLAGRPPLQNLVTAMLLASGGESFAHYQLLTLLLGSLVVLPAALLLRSAAPPWRFATTVLVALLVLNPLVMQNLSYPWTKMGTSAWVLLAVALGERSWRRPEQRFALATAASIAMAAAIITHYSAVVYLAVLGPVHGLVLRNILKRDGEPRPLRYLIVSLAAGGLVLLSWFGWIAGRDGWRALLTSTTTAHYLAGGSDWLQPWRAFGENLLRTLVPHPWLPRPDHTFIAEHHGAAVRDAWFQLYQTTLTLGIGTPALLLLVRSTALRQETAHRYRRVAGVVAALIALGIWVHAAPARWGVAHICLQPLVLGALIWVARTWSTVPAPWRRVALALMLVDAALGIGLQVAMENLAVSASTVAWQEGVPLARLFGHAMLANSQAKLAFSYQFLGDLSPWPPVFNLIAAILPVSCIWLAVARMREEPLPSDGSS